MTRYSKYTSEYFLDSVGRRRKLSKGAMESIMRDFANGQSTLELASTYGVSTTTIRAVCYHIPRRSDVERMKKQVEGEGTT